MSRYQSLNKRFPLAVRPRSAPGHQMTVVPRGFLSEVAMVAVAVVALTVNMKLMSWLTKSSAKK